MTLIIAKFILSAMNGTWVKEIVVLTCKSPFPHHQHQHLCVTALIWLIDKGHGAVLHNTV